MPAHRAPVRRIFLLDVLEPSPARCLKQKASIEIAGPGEETDRTPSFTASLTDHLQTGYAQVAIFFFGRRVLNLAFFLFL